MVAEAGPSGEGTRDRFVIGDIEVEGVSVGGQETCIILPKLNCAFDSGRCPQRAVYQEHLCISHCHIDHIGGVAAHVSSRALLKLPPTTLLLPPDKAEDVSNLLDVFRRLDESDMPCNLTPISAGQQHTLSPRHKVVPFKTYHRVASQGYLIYSTKQKLKPELQGLPSNEIRERKLRGETVTDIFEVPEFAFTGDTTGEFMHDPANADVLTARVLVMELTFLDDNVTVEQARERGHMHIRELADNAHLFKNERILLIHFSARYCADQIVERLDEFLPADLRARCTPLLTGFK